MVRRFVIDSILYFIWGLAFLLANLRAVTFWSLYPEATFPGGKAWLEIWGWLFVFVLVLFVLAYEKLTNVFIMAWRKNAILILFMAFALCSVLWSRLVTETIYRGLALLFTTITGAYLGIRYPIRSLLTSLTWFGIVVVVLSFIVAITLPIFGRMMFRPYDGAWRGIFWNKNHLGSITSFISIVFMIGAINSFEHHRLKSLILAIFYLSSLALTYLSDSAAGLILTILLHGVLVLVLAWLKLAQRLNAKHYFVFFGIIAIVAIGIFLNLDFVFGLFNRSASMTGRVPLWEYLIQEVFSKRVWLGYGFGATWTLESFRLFMQDRFSWGYPILMSDNGFIDMLLDLGIIGFVLFLGIFVSAIKRSLQFGLAERTLNSFLPLIFLFYLVMANISFSLFLELETFTWLILTMFLFSTTRELYFTFGGQKL